MKSAANLKNVDLDLTPPGIQVNTSATDFYPLQDMQLIKFDGERWQAFGEVVSGADTQ
jgi:hypothetical protein